MERRTDYAHEALRASLTTSSIRNDPAFHPIAGNDQQMGRTVEMQGSSLDSPPQVAGVAGALSRLAQVARSRATTAEDIATDFVREAILRAIFPPGARLNPDEIADALGMSRMPIRAALRQLEAERLVENRRFRGARVRTRTLEEIAEIYELRIAIECIALEHVAKNMTPNVLSQLRAAAAAVDDSVEDVDHWIGPRQEFYHLLFESSSKPRMYELVRELRSEVVSYVAMHQVVHAHGGHNQLLDLLAEGKIQEAQAQHREHLQQICDRLIEAMRITSQTDTEARSPLTESELV